MLGNTVKMLIWPPALLTRNCWLLVKSIMKVIGFCGAAADWWNVMKTDWWKVWWSANPRLGWVKLGPGLGVITGTFYTKFLTSVIRNTMGIFFPLPQLPQRCEKKLSKYIFPRTNFPGVGQVRVWWSADCVMQRWRVSRGQHHSRVTRDTGHTRHAGTRYEVAVGHSCVFFI